MKPQLSFLDFEEKRRPQSLFFALLPDSATAAQIGGLAQQLQVQEALSGKLIDADRLHVTLHYLGDYAEVPPSVLDMARRAAETVVLPAFGLGFDQAGSFPGKPGAKPFVLKSGDGNAGLLAFHQALGQALARAGLGRWVKPGWTPHLTLLYDTKTVAEQPVTPLRWTVQEFVLVRSDADAHHYVREGSWPLRTPA